MLALTCAAVDDITAWCLLALVIAVAHAQGLFSVLLTVGLVLYARRGGASTGDYGRLYGKQIPQTQAQAPTPPDVITEAPVQDQYGADPTLVEPAARGQYLGVSPQPGVNPQPATPVQVPAVAAPAPPAPVPAQPGDRVAIVGDEKGVSIARTTSAATPKLTGGFGRQQ